MFSACRAHYMLQLLLPHRLELLLKKCGDSKLFVTVTTAAVSGAVCLYVGWRLGSRHQTGEQEKLTAAERAVELSISKDSGSGSITSRSESLTSGASGSEAGYGTKDTYRLALVVCSDLGMGPGKLASQCCRAFWGEAKKMQQKNFSDLYAWEQDGQTIVVYQISGQQAMLKLRKDTRKAGVISHTMVDKSKNSQKTAIAIGPARSEVVLQLTSQLKYL